MTLSDKAGSIQPADVLSFINNQNNLQVVINCSHPYILMFILPLKAILLPNDVRFLLMFQVFLPKTLQTLDIRNRNIYCQDVYGAYL